MKSLTRYSEAALPTSHGDFRVVVYRVDQNPNDEHVAMVRGDIRARQDVLCRVHSECFTGEVLGSLRCDCQEQLDLALRRIAREDSGVLVYLRQEGRGIGLGNKVRAYALQDQGVDTVDANLALGFDADLRTYEMAAAILRDLSVDSVRLMTNNPAKLRGLEQAGIRVTSHVPHWVEASAENADYLRVKQRRMGHLAAVSGSDSAAPANRPDSPLDSMSPQGSTDRGRPATNVTTLEKDASG
ncbi:MAG: GTP cyclohydrolase II [Proteobacteria bacterium]|nr:GTP cyclohydrolase II [Pseudomonadota bacterium]